MGEPRQILVVDSDVMNLRFLREAIGNLTPFNVDTSPNSQYAFELVLRKQYDLFIFDMGLAEVDGAVLYSLIRKVYELVFESQSPPLLLMSTGEQKQKISTAVREPGVRGYLGKPFTVERLLVKLDEIFPGGRTANPATKSHSA